ncbi:hypothetical protein WQ57_14765 [Mesobacillus campisalis]|uniref:HTH cro/C1-type domain-containing protein n=1 Tax=Mesobacillus campisalis TaxID=1408103 RepID=A0A0M2SU33_9BACI|nr:hypothetical protein WQ57_14765 [Mesobacillus campisalis]
MSRFGSLVRNLREQRGYTLNEFARKIGVSPGYLSNLETGKTHNIKLKILETLQEELGIHPLQSDEQRLEQRMQRISLLFQECMENNPSFAEHFLTQLEQSLELLKEA